MIHTRTGITALLLLLFCIAGVFAQEGLKSGLKAPDFKLPTVGGKRNVTLREFNGKGVVILHFWKSR
ncbi:MAG: hypothetical protein H6Q31_233 [Bacteroidetes bacterium]|jgi:hypothetical protein|nr:hypothetical protein [Bacteroidota bacterium]